MKKIMINGGKPLFGEISISGMKNAAMPIIYACLLVKGDTGAINGVVRYWILPLAGIALGACAVIVGGVILTVKLVKRKKKKQSKEDKE